MNIVEVDVLKDFVELEVESPKKTETLLDLLQLPTLAFRNHQLFYFKLERVQLVPVEFLVKQLHDLHVHLLQSPYSRLDHQFVHLFLLLLANQLDALLVELGSFDFDGLVGSLGQVEHILPRVHFQRVHCHC